MSIFYLKLFAFVILFLPAPFFAQLNPGLQSLAEEFWNWRSIHQPSTMDDIPRIERPDNWKPDFSPAAMKSILEDYSKFKNRLAKLDRSGWSRKDSVDFLCLRSAVERVNWEMNYLRSPFKNPDFYVQQTLGAFYELLVQNIPFSENRINNLLSVLNSFSSTIKSGKENLTEPAASFAKIALDNLDGVDKKLFEVSARLKDKIGHKYYSEIETAFKNAAASLIDYRNWLAAKLPEMKNDFRISNGAYLFFLKNIALIPYSPEEILRIGEMEFDRANFFESIEKNRKTISPKVFATVEREIEQAEIDEKSIRDFIRRNNLFSIPENLSHYRLIKTPDYLSPLTFIGESDDFTSEKRLDQDAVRYTVDPDSNLSFFPLSIAKDPRPVIVHEGIPGHYFQLAMSWRNSDPVRRHFIDSGSNEGIGFYVEEMLLQAGLFDDRPFGREIIYSFMRLRALRVAADINLSAGNFSIEQTADYLEKSVPMNKKYAEESAYFYAYNPGQAISYQIGKHQILNFLNDAKIILGSRFNLKNFHDFLIENGNVPISLLRWEYLGLRNEINQFFDNQ